MKQLICSIFGAGFLMVQLLGQSPTISPRMHCVPIESEVKSNLGPDDAVVFSEIIDLGDAPWVRLFFDFIQLESSSYLRITPHVGDDRQILTLKGPARYKNSTAYFNGPAVTVELVAAAGTKENCVSIQEAVGGGPDEAITGNTPACKSTSKRASSGRGPACKPPRQKDESLDGEKEYCGKNFSCPPGKGCYKFPDEDKAICWVGDPCAGCASKKCNIAESHPPQVQCEPFVGSFRLGNIPSKN